MNTKHLLKFGALFIGLIYAGNAHAFISPKRVVFSKNDTSRAITVFNNSNEPMVYTFDWERRVQFPDGKRKKLAEGEVAPAGYNPADDYLIFSPRKVVINPGKFQTIRLMARRKGDMPDGEYHSHFRAKPEKLSEKKAEEQGKTIDEGTKSVAPDEKGSLSGQISMRAYMSIPIFLRKGDTQIDFTVSDARLGKTEKGDDAINYTINNNSTRSFHSNSQLLCSKSDGTEEKIRLSTKRVYNEGIKIPVIDEAISLPEGLDLKQCNGLKLAIGAMHDPDYKEPIKMVTLR